MLKKLLATALMSLSMLSMSWAAVDVNTADHAGL
ncbi:UNVERIFIED_CONTAM: competence protein ComE, partial [Mumia flava]